MNLIPPDRRACQYAVRGVEDKVMRRVQYAEYVTQQKRRRPNRHVRAATRQQWIGSSDLNQGDDSNAWQHLQEAQKDLGTLLQGQQQ